MGKYGDLKGIIIYLEKIAYTFWLISTFFIIYYVDDWGTDGHNKLDT